MKAATKKNRWLLVALLFGVLTAAGFTLAHHHGSRTVAKANDATAPKHTVRQQAHATVFAAIGGKHSFRAPAGVSPEPLDTTYANTTQPSVAGHSGAPWNTASGASTRTGWSIPANYAAGESGNSTPSPGNRPATSGTPLLQALANGLAYNYSPLDCELPAGCGATSGASSLTRQPSGTSAGTPFAHDSGSTGDTGGAGGTGGTNNTGGTGNTGNTSDPPANNPPAAAPELDPGTLAAALTLLFGGLAMYRSRRRARATR